MRYHNLTTNGNKDLATGQRTGGSGVPEGGVRLSHTRSRMSCAAWEQIHGTVTMYAASLGHEVVLGLRRSMPVSWLATIA
jgi:hypothetical protein